MQKGKVNITMDKDLIEYAKAYADEQRTTVSEVFTQFILNLKRVKEAVRTELREKIKNCFDLPSEMPKDGSEDARIRVDGAFIRTFGTTPKIHTLL